MSINSGSLSGATLPEDPPPSAARVFGDALCGVISYADLLTREGELRGLIGPRELPRLWTRHLLNSSAVVPFIPEASRFADIGSGAGFPGIVVALMRPDLEVCLIEPMERRTTWLTDVVNSLSLDNVTVVRARAEELHGRWSFDVVGARAVAAMKKLVPWATPLIEPGGRLVAMKGERAASEVREARAVMEKFRLTGASVHEVMVEGAVETTHIVGARRQV